MIQIRESRYGQIIFSTIDQYVGASIEKYGEFSEYEGMFFQSFVRPGSVVMDIGANIGAHTLALAKATGPSGMVLSYEPQRTLCYMMCGSVVLNELSNVFCFNQAVGEEVGSIEVPNLDYSVYANYGGLCLVENEQNWDGGHGVYRVKQVSIDSLNLPTCDFVKVDVEGMELSVLKGATETMARCKTSFYVEDDRVEKTQAVNDFMREHGYDIIPHCPPLFNPNNFDGNKENIFGDIVSRNILCIHKDSGIKVNLPT